MDQRLLYLFSGKHAFYYHTLGSMQFMKAEHARNRTLSEVQTGVKTSAEKTTQPEI